jgi:serine/threonine protein kinase
MPALDLDVQTWARLSALLDQALDVAPAGRRAWLESLSHQHESLQPRLLEFLARAVSVETHDFLETLPKLDLDERDLGADPDGRGRCDQAGEVLGPYRLVRELGSGGMGTVWLAERADGLVNRPVALKLPHGAWRRAGLAGRMAREREFLAALNHPHIARLYDAGTTSDGQPWLAIEYVEGQPIDEYCRERALSMAARLGLFLQVVRAVAYAHGKLILHRDLKPGNILVTPEGHTRLLDFGIAKLLADGEARQTQLTVVNGRALTPDYASPEQIVGMPLTIASDVYSLGVLLYELLTGQRPYRLTRNSRGALEDAIVLADPARPSDVAGADSRTLRGDLDTIVLKALKKDPEERYATAHALAEDLVRHLEHRPVLALPDSFAYRTRKFLRRHRVLISVALVAAVAVLATAGVAVWQARVALAETERARQIAAFTTSIFSDANPYQRSSGKVLTGVELLEISRDRIAALGSLPPEVRIELMNLLGESLASLESNASAEQLLRQSLAAAVPELGAQHRETLEARRLLSQVLRVTGRVDEARQEIERAVPLARANVGERPEHLVAMLTEETMVAARQGRFADAAVHGKEALGLIATHLHDQSRYKVKLLAVMYSAHRFLGQFAESRAAAQRGYEAAVAMYGAASRHPLLTEARFYQAGAFFDVGRGDAGVEQMRIVFADTEALFGPTSRLLGARLSSTSVYFAGAGYFDEAIANATRGKEILDTSPQLRDRTAAAENLGFTHLTARHGADAVHGLTTAVAGYTEVYGAQNETVMNVTRSLSLALAYDGRTADALQKIAYVAEHHPRMSNDSYDDTSYTRGLILRLSGRSAEALASQERALASIATSEANPVTRASVLVEIGLDELALERRDVAEAHLREASDLFARTLAQMVPAHADALIALAQIELAAGSCDRTLTGAERASVFWQKTAPATRWANDAEQWLARCRASKA